VDKTQVNDWLTEYIAAWESYEPGRIAALFTDDAEYRYYPYDDPPVVGGDAIAKSWLEEERRDPPGSWKARYECIAVDGDVAVATGESLYFNDDKTLKEAYDNAYVMRFADDGRCSMFTEYYVKRPGKDQSASG
jgi:ketosteroid isomerase-like protein